MNNFYLETHFFSHIPAFKYSSRPSKMFQRKKVQNECLDEIQVKLLRTITSILTEKFIISKSLPNCFFLGNLFRLLIFN